MTDEDKDLLYIDLCARLPYYGLMVQWHGEDYNIIDIGFGRVTVLKPFMSMTSGSPLIEEVKPYLRSMSTMTSKEWVEYCDACLEDEKSFVWAGKKYKFTPVTHKEEFLNSHHFDHRGLIPMGLALEAKEGMYKTKTE